MMVRTNPLPAGRYWIWIAAKDEPLWLAYRVKNFGVLTIESDAATHEGYGWNEVRSGTTYIFRTTAPLQWPSGIGFANTAAADLKTADTVQRPATVPTLADDARRIASEAEEAANTLATVVVVGLLLWVLTKHR